MMMPLRILERHTADLIEKYSVLPGPESIKNQESKKSPKEIIRIKKNKTANRNPANYHLYHALMEALIADEDAMDKEVKDRVKDHKRKHDNEGHVLDLEDTDNAYIPKVTAATWFKPIPEDERPATPEPEWTIPLNDFPEPENNWENAYATTYQVPGKNKLQRKTYDIDCVRAEPVILKKLESSSDDVALLRAYAGDIPTWRNPHHPWRVDSKFKLKGVLTLTLWENGEVKC
ncbi:thioredoxin-like protein Clot [Tanacetum coccineum]